MFDAQRPGASASRSRMMQSAATPRFPPSRRALGIGAGFLFVLCATLGTAYTVAKERALGFHTRDYAYYVEFVAKAFDPRQPKEFSLNPRGVNVFRFMGTEGEGGFHRSLHFEPIKYVEALVWRLRAAPSTLFALTATIFFIPLLYAAWAAEDSVVGRWKTLAFLVVYVLAPSSMLAVANDLRPFTFMVPFFSMTFLAIHWRRPAWEQALAFNAMFLAREEAVILGVCLVGYAVATRLGRGEPRRSWRAEAMLAGCVVAWGILTLGYFRWTGYESGVPYLLRRHWALVAIAVAGIGGAALVGTVHQGTRRWVGRHLAVLVLLSLGPLFGMQLLEGLWSGRYPTVFTGLFFHPYSLLVLLWALFVTFEGRPGALGPPLIGCVAAFLLLLHAGSFGPMSQVRAFSTMARAAEPVWRLRREMSGTDAVLTDFATHQAFYGVRAYAYERLPLSVAGERRDFPENRPNVKQLLGQAISHVVIGRDSETDVRGLVSEVPGVTLEGAGGNERFAVYRVRRPPGT